MIAFQPDINRVQKDQQIIRLIKNRDKEGISILYDTYSSVLLLMILRRENQRAAAEEKLVGCFINAWNNINDYNGEKWLLSWLITFIPNNLPVPAIQSNMFIAQNKIYSIKNPFIKLFR